MNKNILTILLILYAAILTSQDSGDSYLTRPLNGVYLNLLGDASVISINYEKLFPMNKNIFITSKLGFGYSSELIAWNPPAKSFVTLPFHLSSIIGRNRSFIEIGMGATLSFGDDDSRVLYPILGYRLQPLKAQKFNFRIYIQWPTKLNDIPYFFPLGFSLGASF